MKQVCFFFFLLSSLQTFSQKVALKNNLAYDALLTPNLSVEFSLGKKWTLDAQVGMNFFFYENDATATRYKTRKWRVEASLSNLFNKKEYAYTTYSSTQSYTSRLNIRPREVMVTAGYQF